MKSEREHREQSAVVQWARFHAKRYPELDLLFAVPNGGARNKVTAAKLKREGVRRGVWDLWLPVRRSPWSGLVVEMKIKPNGLTPDQGEFGAAIADQGFQTIVAYTWTEAVEAIESYLTGRPVAAWQPRRRAP